ncbi:MAG TPA: hypothetical protein VE196_05125, partial [Pseudonocardiaceae bacterium]|nr:hypothetical protein [Pseudonocardiaceae bacterium]
MYRPTFYTSLTGTVLSRPDGARQPYFDLQADVFYETRWQRHERAASARFREEATARTWITGQLERLRGFGRPLDDEDAACYVAELSCLPDGPIVCNAYLFDGASPIEWDEGELPLLWGKH